MKQIMIAGLLILFSQPCHAQEASVADGILDSMESLYQSVAQLSEGNHLLVLHLNEVNMKLEALQTRLQQLTMENDRLNRETLKLQEIDPVLSRKIASSEKEIYDLDAKLEDLRAKTKTETDAIKAAPAQEERISARIKELEKVVGSQKDEDPHAKEKLQLLKMIEASKRRQGELYSQMLLSPVEEPIVRVESTSERENLRKSVEIAQSEVDQLKRFEKSAQVSNVDQAQIKLLQDQVALLSKNCSAMEDVVLKLQQKVQGMKENKDQMKEFSRLKDNLDKLNQQKTVLQAQLSDLRLQMVGLDKRKAHLESLLGK